MLTGGGSLGPVTPVLAIAQAWRAFDSQAEFVWVGTPDGPERSFVEQEHIPFEILNAPKLYRYLTPRLLFIPFQAFASLVKAVILLFRYRPAWIVSAGGYVGVPLVCLSWLTGSRVLIHQLDVPILLANKIMSPFASVVTATWPEARKQFSRKKVFVVGSPVYERPLTTSDPALLAEKFDLPHGRPTLLVQGGGGGSASINGLMKDIAPQISREINVIHVTGYGKNPFTSTHPHEGYRVFEMIGEEMGEALQLADAIVSRAGMGSIAEYVKKGKAAIYIPLPNTPQELNAKMVSDRQAGFVLEQGQLNSILLEETIRKILEPETRRRFEKRIRDLFDTRGVARKIVEIIHQENN